MTHPEHERDEHELKALFDATAEEPSGAQLTKLRARAADVPGRARRPRWLFWAPFAAVAAGALLVVMLQGGAKDAEVARGTSTASVRFEAPAPSVTQHAPAPSQESTPDEEAPEENGALAELGDLNDGDDFEDFPGPLDEPDDAELDDWLAATSSFLEDG